MAREHRVESMLHHRGQNSELIPYLPTGIANRWAEQYRQAAVNSLHIKRLLLDLVDILSGAEIPFLALKGSWLAWQVYPDPALRPMRDVDILVRKEEAIRTFERLKAEGFTQSDCLNIPLEYLLETSKHLPGLACPKSGKKVEIHSYLHTPDSAKRYPDALSEFDELAARSHVAAMGNGEIAFPSPTDSLLHIIVHAVDGHFFNNGPVVILDVHQILQRCQIDWPAFWALAKEGRWINSARLMFDMVEHYHGEQPIDWQDMKREPAPTSVIEAAAAISLQTIDARANFSLAVGLARKPKLNGKIAHFADRLMPSRYTLSEIGNVPAESARVFLSYPTWFLRSLRKFVIAAPRDVSASSLVSPVVAWLAR